MREKEHWWLYTIHDGKPLLIYGGTSEEEARSKGLQYNIMFEVIMLPTNNTATASRMFKGRMLRQTGDLDSSLRRLGHTT